MQSSQDKILARLFLLRDWALRAFNSRRPQVVWIGKAIALFFGSTTALLFASTFYLLNAFTQSPIKRDAAQGLVVPWNNHGTMHYISVEQSNLYEVTSGLAVTAFFLTAIGILLTKLASDSGS